MLQLYSACHNSFAFVVCIEKDKAVETGTFQYNLEKIETLSCI